jgi:uncharacterized protein (TIGR02996 family)
MPTVYTHPDWDLLLRAVCAAPDDDLPRLVAADWLDEHGEAERAEFIRVQVERARADRPDLKWREKGLLDNPLFGALWAAEACPNLVRLTAGAGVRGTAVSGAERVTFRRGFPDRVSCPAADWLKFGGGVVPRQPVREVHLIRCDDPPAEDWWGAVDTLRQVRVVGIDSRRTYFPTWLQEHLGPAVEVRVNGDPAPLVLVADALPDLRPPARPLPPSSGGSSPDRHRHGDAG